MWRRFGLLAILAAGMGFSAGGCRSCDSCDDYSSPVANCNCDSCGCHRAGSASSGYAEGGYAEGEYISGETVQGPYVQDGEWVGQQ